MKINASMKMRRVNLNKIKKTEDLPLFTISPLDDFFIPQINHHDTIRNPIIVVAQSRNKMGYQTLREIRD